MALNRLVFARLLPRPRRFSDKAAAINAIFLDGHFDLQT
jgi:hypothetical protein